MADSPSCIGVTTAHRGAPKRCSRAMIRSTIPNTIEMHNIVGGLMAESRVYREIDVHSIAAYIMVEYTVPA